MKKRTLLSRLVEILWRRPTRWLRGVVGVDFSVDWKVVRKSDFHRLRAEAYDLRFVLAIEPRFRSECLDNLRHSNSQLRQDLFALAETGFRRDGFFVEFGAVSV